MFSGDIVPRGPTFTESDKESIRREYLSGATIQGLCKKYKTSPGRLNAILEEGDVEKRSAAETMKLRGTEPDYNRTPLSERDKDIIAEAYSAGQNVQKEDGILEEWSISDRRLERILDERGIEKRSAWETLRLRGESPQRGPSLACDHEFFSVIDTEPKAYFLGLMMADGCVHKHRGSECYIVRLGLAECDRGILERFREELGSEHKISVTDQPEGSFGDGGRQAALQIASRQLFDDLVSWGCFPRKSGKEVPQHHRLDEGLRRHYWRGWFDGDGSLGLSVLRGGEKRPFSDLVGSKVACQQFADWVRSAGIETKMSARKRKGKKRLWSTGTTGRPAVDIARLLYSNCGVVLERKEERWKRIERESGETPEKGR